MARNHKTRREAQAIHSALAHEIDQAKHTFVLNLSHLKTLDRLPTIDPSWHVAHINLENTIVSDLSPIASLPSLVRLNLESTNVIDLSPLSGLTGIEWLNLKGTKVVDLSPLSKLTGLKNLNISGTDISDLSPLSKLTKLRHLNLENTRVTDLAPMLPSNELVSLNLENTRLADITLLSRLKHLSDLNLAKTDVTDLSPLAELTALKNLNLWRILADDLSVVSGLTSLEHLTLWGTKISDLSLISGLTKLEWLDIDGTAVRDLSPLRGSNKLESLYASNTKVVDLTPLSELVTLRTLTIDDTNVDNLAPLASLPNLRRLRLNDTPVSDLSPVANLRSLHQLEFNSTQVQDLSPLAHLTGLVTAVEEGFGGLAFGNTPLLDPVLRGLAEEPDPNRTIDTLNHIRRQQKLPPLDNNIRPAPLPEMPVQGPGPHFVLNDEGVVTFAPPSSLDQQGNNVSHLRALHPTLRELAQNLVEALNRGNVPHANLHERAQSYLALVDQSLDSIPFARLYVEGVRLQNASTATAAKIVEKELPSFDASVHETLESLLKLHGAFVLSTSDGLALLEAEERFQRRPQEEQELRAATLAFAQSLQGQPEIIEPGVASFVLRSAEEMGAGVHLERSNVVASGTTKNAAIVVFAGATIGAFPVVGGLMAGPAGLVGGGLAALVGAEALKKSKSFLAIAGLVTKGIDRLTEEDLRQHLANKASSLAPYVKFVLKTESVLRALAKKSAAFSWIDGSLDWIRSQTNRTEDKEPEP
jgi:Leucine-rich repeat (LRR) protein